jgi:hypothetical protein
MNVSQLINILSEMDGEADVVLFVDKVEYGVIGSELVELELDDVVIGETYVGLQVPPEFTGGLDE